MHPTERELALFAGGDLGFIDRWRVGRHLRRCAECRREVARFEFACGSFTAEAERFPAGLQWERLSSEMTANIRVGLAAGECVGPVDDGSLRAWRPAAVVASAVAVITVAWLLSVPPTLTHSGEAQRVRSASVLEMEETPVGLEVKAQSGAALTLLRRKASSPVLYVSSPGSLRERFVDAETGQVTINNVYTE